MCVRGRGGQRASGAPFASLARTYTLLCSATFAATVFLLAFEFFFSAFFTCLCDRTLSLNLQAHS